MGNNGLRATDQGHEAAGFLVAVVFVCLSAFRDVYLGAALQRIAPLVITIAAFSLCTLVFLPSALRCRQSMSAFRRRPSDLLWVNVTSAGAWIAFLYALKLIEPTIVQILYSGIGPLSVIWAERYRSRAKRVLGLTLAERVAYGALLTAIAFAAVVVLLGLSGTGRQPINDCIVGVVLAIAGGVCISVSVMLCRKLNDAGATPAAVLALRYPGAVIIAAIVAACSSASWPDGLDWIDGALLVAVALIIVPTYVNQVAISLASPLTVRVVLAVAPALIFVFQMIEGRLITSSYSLLAALLYGFAAVSAAVARRLAIRRVGRAGGAET
jgi:drug/metabolite transporter (DMT)-like permease